MMPPADYGHERANEKEMPYDAPPAMRTAHNAQHHYSPGAKWRSTKALLQHLPVAKASAHCEPANAPAGYGAASVPSCSLVLPLRSEPELQERSRADPPAAPPPAPSEPSHTPSKLSQCGVLERQARKGGIRAGLSGEKIHFLGLVAGGG